MIDAILRDACAGHNITIQARAGAGKLHFARIFFYSELF